MSRIDDALRRILRVKLRAGLSDNRKPSERPDADLPLNISVGDWVTNEINLADFPGFNWAELTSVLEMLPVWDSNHAKVHFQVDNIQILAN